MLGARRPAGLFAAVLAALALIAAAPVGRAQEKEKKGPPAEEAARLQKVVEKLRGLSFKHPVTVGVQGKDELRKKLLADFQKEFPREKAAKFQKALEKFGFMKPGGDLWQIVVDLLTEQIAGFYDPESKELYLIADHLSGGGEDEDEDSGGGDPTEQMMAQMLGIDQDRLVTVHELTHALQDQNYDLLTLPMGLEDNDDLVTAVKSVVEGEATFVMFEDITRKMGMGLEDMPGIDNMLDMGGSMPGGPGAEALGKAPEYLKRGLVFPYMGGLRFIQAVKKARGWEGVNGLYADMPASSEQVLHPEKYLDARDQPTTVKLADLAPVLGADWEPLLTNVWGELNLEILFKEFFPTSKTSSVTNGWDGDQFRVYERARDGALMIAWFTVWDSEKDAEQFSTAYKKLIAKKYGVDSPAEKQERYQWSRESGDVVLQRRGAEVLVLEDVPADLRARTEEALWKDTERKELPRVERVARPTDGAAGGQDAGKIEKPKKVSHKGEGKPAGVKGDGWAILTRLSSDCCTWTSQAGTGEASCSDCSAVFRATAFPAGQGETLADALAIARKRLGAHVEGMKILSQKPVKVDGRAGTRVVIQGTPQDVGESVTMDLVIVQGQGRFFVFVDAVSSADYESCKEMFSAWIKSAKIEE